MPPVTETSENNTQSAPSVAVPPAAPPLTAAALTWNETAMATHFANVVNVQSTREQVDLFFGTNKSWNASDTAQITVDLSNRIILTPFAAKRLLSVLGNVLKEYEGRYGSLVTDP